MFDNKLNSTDSSQLDGVLTIVEKIKEVFRLKNDKIPGIDRITAEFYKTF